MSLIHGNSSAFYIVFEDIFKTIYEFWRDYRPAAGLLRDTGRALRERIQVLTEHSEYHLLICEDILWSGCQGRGSGADGQERHESVQQGGGGR